MSILPADVAVLRVVDRLRREFPPRLDVGCTVRRQVRVSAAELALLLEPSAAAVARRALEEVGLTKRRDRVQLLLRTDQHAAQWAELVVTVVQPQTTML